ncbi:MAG: hypothetical protein JWP80_3899 [Pseudomonas sp.]|nr:hypothetical protein [Pseudomonas sp.]
MAAIRPDRPSRINSRDRSLVDRSLRQLLQGSALVRAANKKAHTSRFLMLSKILVFKSLSSNARYLLHSLFMRPPRSKTHRCCPP